MSSSERPLSMRKMFSNNVKFSASVKKINRLIAVTDNLII